MSNFIQKSSRILENLFQTILDFFFPRRCFGCDSYDTFLCESCFQKIPRRAPVTETITSVQSPLDSLTAATYFGAPIVSSLIHHFKFSGIQELSLPLGRLIVEAVEHTSLPLPSYITVVPLHQRRFRERSYNQSALLAEELRSGLARSLITIELVLFLKRVRNTKPQSKLKNREQRLHNLDGAFCMTEDTDTLVSGKVIWLIDDVATTRTTLTECAKILKQAGAKEVHGIVVAR